MKHLCKLLLALVLGCSSLAAPAQTASRPLRILVPFSAGGASDTYTRIAALKITEQTGKPIVVENRTGAGGRIAWEAAAKSAIETAGKSLRDLRVAEVVRQDVTIENGKVGTYRVRLNVSFKYEGTTTPARRRK